MLRKSLLIVVILLLPLYQVMASDDWLDFDLGAGIGVNGGYGYGYEALLEYRFSEKTSLYITGNLMKNMEATHEDNHDYDMETGEAQMVGMQIRFFEYLLVGYHRITNHESTPDVLTKAKTATSFGFINSGKEWEGGLLFYILDDEAKNGESSSSGGFFIRRKFFF